MLVLINLTELRKTYWIPKFEFHKEKKIWSWEIKFLCINFKFSNTKASTEAALCDARGGCHRCTAGELPPPTSTRRVDVTDNHIQLYVTYFMRRQLTDLNFTKSQIDQLTPEKAAEHIRTQTGPS